jgi:hypothetical protein
MPAMPLAAHPAASASPLSTVDAAAAAASLDMVRQQWPQVLERLAERKMSLAAYLADSRPTGVRGTEIQVGLPAFALHQEVLSSTEGQRLIESILAEVFGSARSISYTTPLRHPSTVRLSSSTQRHSAAFCYSATVHVPKCYTTPIDASKRHATAVGFT